MPRTRKFRITTSREEISHLLRAWFAISLAFAIASTIPFSGFTISSRFFLFFAISAITVGSGFLLHELSHKILAQRYGCFAEFRSDAMMLLLAIAISFTGFIFAAPGAVFIKGKITKEQNGRISAAGPVVNILLAIIFLGLGLITDNAILDMISSFGTYINALLAVFNLLPFGIFDGQKVFNWNKIAYSALMVSAVSLLVMYFLVGARAV